MGAATGMAGGAAKFFSGRKMEKKAQKFIDKFEWQDLQNPFRNEQVSTLGSELQTEQSNIGTATATEALRTGGQRALVGGLGRVEAKRSEIARTNAAGLDEQQKAINTRIAQQEVLNQSVMEKRQADELAGYGAMLNTGMGMKWQGIDNMVNAAASIEEDIKGAVTGAVTGGVGGAAGGTGGAAGGTGGAAGGFFGGW